jgi:hypothetical protein
MPRSKNVEPGSGWRSKTTIQTPGDQAKFADGDLGVKGHVRTLLLATRLTVPPEYCTGELPEIIQGSSGIVTLVIACSISVRVGQVESSLWLKRES